MTFRSRLLSCLTAAAVCLGVYGVTSLTSSRELTQVSAEETKMTAVQSFISRTSSDYGYNYLGTLTNGKSMQALYKMIYDAAASVWNDSRDFPQYTTGSSYYEIGTVRYASLGLTVDEARKTFLTVRNDCPMFYYLSTIAPGSTTLWLLSDEDYRLGSVRAEHQRQIFEYFNTAAKKADGLTSEYAKALFVNDALISDMKYSWVTAEDGSQSANSASWAHNVIGAAEHGEGVCESYAKSFQALGNYIGLDTVYVLGKANGGDHAWNMVKLEDGNYYYVDCTWNDNPDGHQYFACDKEVMDERHTAFTPDTSDLRYFLYGLPEAPETGYTASEYKPLMDTYTYTVDGGKAVVSKYLGSSTSVTVPSEINGYPVGGIGAYAFVQQSVTSVTLPDSIEYIDTGAFAACQSLQTINIPSEIRELGQDAFFLCNKLNGVTLPEGLEKIGSGALFYVNTASGKKSITIPASVKELGEYSVGYYTGGSGFRYSFDGNYPSGSMTGITNFSISCYSGTAGEAYAKANASPSTNGITYKILTHTHSYTAKVTAPTYTQQGYTLHICPGCGKSYTDSYTDRIPRPGDLGGDGLVGQDDVTLMKGLITDTGSEGSTALADVDADGEVTNLDYAILKAYLAGIPIELKAK